MEPESKEDSGIALFNFILEYMDKNMHDPQIKKLQPIFYQFQPNQKGEAKEYKKDHDKYWDEKRQASQDGLSKKTTKKYYDDFQKKLQYIDSKDLSKISEFIIDKKNVQDD